MKCLKLDSIILNNPLLFFCSLSLQCVLLLKNWPIKVGKKTKAKGHAEATTLLKAHLQQQTAVQNILQQKLQQQPHTAASHVTRKREREFARE